jgi:simple sugar transport system permease protein
MLNIALEGLLLIGAFSAIATVYFTGSFTTGLVAAIIASMLLAAILAGTSIKLRSNVFITGLAVNLLASGLTIVLSHYLFNTRGVVALQDISRLSVMVIPFINNIPVIGELLSGHSVYVYASWLLSFLSWLVIYKTPFGYRLRACDNSFGALVSLGLCPVRCRWFAFLISGLCCGIGGSFLSLNLGAFVPNMTAGKGWIALVVIFLGVRRPLGLIAAAFVYGLAEAFSNHTQGLFNIPADFILAMPYLFALVAMILVSVWVKQKIR